MRQRKDLAATSHARGVAAEAAACAALMRDGWSILARRLRTEAGEIDIVAEAAGVVVLAEVKSRRRLADAASAITPRQQARLLAAAELVLADHPHWGRMGVRIDLLVVDAAGRVRRIADAVRAQ